MQRHLVKVRLQWPRIHQLSVLGLVLHTPLHFVRPQVLLLVTVKLGLLLVGRRFQAVVLLQLLGLELEVELVEPLGHFRPYPLFLQERRLVVGMVAILLRIELVLVG